MHLHRVSSARLVVNPLQWLCCFQLTPISLSISWSLSSSSRVISVPPSLVASLPFRYSSSAAATFKPFHVPSREDFRHSLGTLLALLYLEVLQVAEPKAVAAMPNTGIVSGGTTHVHVSYSSTWTNLGWAGEYIFPSPHGNSLSATSTSIQTIRW